MIQYFKQAWNLIKQEKLFSSIYIIGTGLSITIVMVLSIVFYLRVANIYPETNRDRLLVAKSGMIKDTNNDGMSSSSLSLNLIETCFRPVNGIEAMTAVCTTWDKYYVQPTGTKEQLPVTVKYVDPDFWKVFSFRFIKGSQFSEADFQSGIRTVVISEFMAKRIFGTIDVIGNYVSMNFMQYRICGVVKDVSSVTTASYAHLWIPYTVYTGYNNTFGSENLLGKFVLYILAPSKNEIAKIKSEAIGNIQKIGNTLPDGIELSLLGQPDTYLESTFRVWSNVAPDFNIIKLQYSIILFVLLLVPGISLSGMADSRMERRLVEMGIRRAFGAPVKTLMLQILSENFLFTLIGGFAGLLFSYLLILLNADWVMSIGQGSVEMLPEGESTVLSSAMLINIPVFLITLGVCFLLNILTAFIPAWRSSHKEITYSLNTKN